MEKKQARLVLLAVTLISLGFIAILPRIGFNYDFESFFPTGDPDLESYLEYRDKFGSDNDYILIGIENEAGVFDSTFLSRVDAFADSCKSLPFITKVVSPTDLKQFIMGPLGPATASYMHINRPDLYAKDSLRIYANPSLVGSFFSTTGKALTVVLESEAGLNKLETDTVAIAVEALSESAGFDDINVAGRATGQMYFVEKMKYEMFVFASISVVLVIIFLAFTFRSVWGVVIPLITVLLAIIWLLGVMVLTGKPLDVMSTLLPIIMLVVGMSDAVHIVSRYIEELRMGRPKKEAIRIAFKHIGLATLLTSITTAIGFLTLLTSAIQPIRDFGIYTAIGVMLALVLAFSILPAFLSLMKPPKVAALAHDRLFWYRNMHRSFLQVVKHPKRILLISIGVIALSGFGMSLISIDNYFLEDLSEDDPHRARFEFFEEHFAGVRPYDLHIVLTDSTKQLTDPDMLVALDRLETYLLEAFPIGFISSPVGIFKELNAGLNGGKPEFRKLPNSQSEWNQVNRFFNRIKKRPEVSSLFAEDFTECRVSAKVVDVGGKRFKELNDQMIIDLPEVLGTDALEVRFTGMSFLIDKNNELLSGNMMSGLVIAFGIIALIMGGLFRSIRMVIISLIPNMLPLMVIAGFMGFAGIDLKVSTSIIFTIAFGIAVDDTIHYMSKLRMELNKGKSLLYALKRTQLSTGKAITITSLILLAGFIALSFSDFGSTHYIGLLVSMTLFMAVIADLYLLPTLVLLFFPDPKKKNLD